MTLTVGDTDHRFGPQGVEVDKLIRRISVLTADEVDELTAVWSAAPWAVSDTAWDATWAVAWHAAWAARNAAWDATRAVPMWSEEASMAAAWAATAVSVRHLIGRHGFTQTHYDLLTSPWRQVIGPVHPDDKETT